MNLTEEQQAIINHPGGHARVSAVAGSGKTTTMVARVGHLLEQGVAADQLLVLMFNKSARDGFVESMQKRLVQFAPNLPEVRTFHALGLRLVNSFTKRGSLPAFTLVSKEYVLGKLARQVVTQVYRDRENEGWLSGDEIAEFLGFIDYVKSSTGSVEDIFEQLGLTSKSDYFIDAYYLFERVRKEQKIRFFADLIHEPLMAMLANEDLSAWVANRVEHIIVDEYQDINDAQQRLLKIIAGARAQVMVVGDVDQCIYEWRGARPDYITSRFRVDFPEPQNYILSFTFRFGHKLSLAANNLISRNIERDRKLCVSHPSTCATQLFQLEEKDIHPLPFFLADWLSDGRSLREAVILVRLYAQTVPVELALLEGGIPYRLEGNERVFNCPEILALVGYLKLALGILANDEIDIRKATIVAMLSQPHLGVKREELENIAEDIAADSDCSSELIFAKRKENLPEFLRKRFVETAENWRWLKTQAVQGRVDHFLKKVVDKIKLYDFYFKFSARSTTAENRVKTCEAFIKFSGRQNLSAVDLLTKIERLRLAGLDQQLDSVLITSVHRAKGLEWPLVVLPGLEEGSFPFYEEMTGGEISIEDERRLFYVAITRAVEKLCLIYPVDTKYARSRKRENGRVPDNPLRASRFLFEANFDQAERLGEILNRAEQDEMITVIGPQKGIAKKYFKAVGIDVQFSQQGKKEVFFLNKTILKMDEIGEGLRVWHEDFGRGIVKEVKDRRQGRIEVSFDNEGDVILLVKYARLRSC